MLTRVTLNTWRMLHCEARISELIKMINYDYSFIYFPHKVNKILFS